VPHLFSRINKVPFCYGKQSSLSIASINKNPSKLASKIKERGSHCLSTQKGDKITHSDKHEHKIKHFADEKIQE
jgi:hypothetical protein